MHTRPNQDQEAACAGQSWARLTQLASRSARQLRKSLADQVGRLELNDTEFLLLWCCGRGGKDGVSQTSLAGSLGISPAQVSGLVDRLRDRGLLVAERSQSDRRRQSWRLSPQGDKLLAVALDDVASLGRRLEAAVPKADRRTLEQLLVRLTESVEKSPALKLFAPDDEPAGGSTSQGKAE